MLLLNVPAWGMESGFVASKLIEQFGATCERAERETARKVLAERRDVGAHAEQIGEAAWAVPRCHHLVGDEDRTCPLRCVGQTR